MERDRESKWREENEEETENGDGNWRRKLMGRERRGEESEMRLGLSPLRQ